MEVINKQIENERKFILKRIPDLDYDDIIFIKQYYINYEDKVYRLRYNFKNSCVCKLINIELIHKEKIGIGQNIEHHVECNKKFADKLVNEAFKFVNKKRYIFKENNLKYEIDEFLDIPFCMLEIEVEDINSDVYIPKLIENEILLEITGNNKFDNFNLALDIK